MTLLTKLNKNKIMKNSKPITILFLSLFVPGFLYAQSAECMANMKTGTFEYKTEGVTITIARTKTKQIESYDNGKSKVISKITWISDNEYISTFVKAVNAPGCLKKGDEVRVKILACNAKEYTASIVSEKCGSGETTISKIE